MSYRNPQIIRDTSAELYGRAAANIGQSLARGIERAGINREQQRKEAKAETDRVQRISYGISSKAYEQRNKNYAGLKKTEPGIAEQYNNRTEQLLNGYSGQMGAIEASVLLATDSTLTSKRRQELQGIVNRYESFSAGMVSNAGKIISETNLYNKTSPADFNNKYRWSGSNDYERSASQYAAAALSNQEIPGGRYEKTLDEPGLNGENIMSVKIYLDPNDPENKGLFDDKQTYPRNENGEVELEWKKDLNKWDEGLLEEIEPVPDSIKIFQTAGITNKNGGFNDNQYVNIVSGSRTVNVNGWAKNRVLQDDIKSKAAGLQTMRDDELSSFLQVKMKLGPNFSMTEFRKKSTPEQVKQIQDELNEEYIIQKTSGLNSREAKEGEPGAIIDPLNPIKENGDKNYKVYYEKTAVTTSSSKGTQAENALEIYNEIARDPLSAYNRYKQGPGEQASLVEGSIITVPKFDENGEPEEPVRYNMDRKKDRAIFFQEIFEVSNLVGKDDKGRKIRLQFPKIVDEMSDKYIEQKAKKSKKKLPIITKQ